MKKSGRPGLALESVDIYKLVACALLCNPKQTASPFWIQKQVGQRAPAVRLRVQHQGQVLDLRALLRRSKQGGLKGAERIKTSRDSAHRACSTLKG